MRVQALFLFMLVLALVLVLVLVRADAGTGTYMTAWLRAVTLELAPSELRLSDCALTGQRRWSCTYTNYD